MPLASATPFPYDYAFTDTCSGVQSYDYYVNVASSTFTYHQYADYYVTIYNASSYSTYKIKYAISPYQLETYEPTSWLAGDSVWIHAEYESSNPILIDNFTQLDFIRNMSDTCFILNSSVDMIGNNWIPISNYNNATFDGNGKTLSNLYINSPSLDYVGLFASTYDATITDFTLDNVSIDADTFIGGIAGIAFNTDFSDINVTGNISGTYNLGMAGGMLRDGCTATRIITYGNVSSDYTTSAHVGGQWGYVREASVISQCGAYGEVYAPATYRASGFCSVLTESSTITDCYTRSNVTGLSSVAGFSYAIEGSVVSNCYSAGELDYTGSVYGFGNTNWIDLGTVTSSYWDVDVSNVSTSTGGTGKTTSQMMLESTYSSWDFSTVWQLEGYPILQFEELDYNINPTIIYPENATEIDSDYPALTDVAFIWSGHAGASSSSYQLSRDSNYNTLVSSGTTTNNYKTLSLDADDYYFRVKYDFSDWTETQFSINTTVSDYGTAIQGVVYDITDGDYIALSGARLIAYSTSGYSTQSTVTGSNGYYLFDDIDVDKWTLVVSKDGYESASVEVNVTDGNTSTTDIYLEQENAPTYITPHYVEFVVRSWTTKYEDVQINVYIGDSATVYKSGLTDSEGSITFELSETTKYRITAYKEGIIDREVTKTPSFTKFTFWVGIGELIDDILSGHNGDLANSVFIMLSQDVVTGTEATITVNYNDTSESTSVLDITLEQQVYADVGNYSIIDNVTYLSDSLVTHVFTLNDSVFYGETYIIHIISETDDFGTVDKMYAVTFEPSSDVFGISIEIFIWIIVALIIWFGSTATETSVYTTMFGMGCLTGILKIMGLTGDYVSSFGIILVIVAGLAGYLYQTERND